MQIFKQIMPLRYFLSQKRNEKLSIGLVPTMGALHDGHLSLIEACKKKCDITVVSIFVNPTQFNNREDFEKYPVTMVADQALLEKVGTDVLFCPAVEEMYHGNGYLSMQFGRLDTILEGKYRPGHFSGVGLIVSKFFNIVQPDVAFFGQKDLQQVAVIKKLNNELAFGIDLQVVPTVRDTDGLALSSRNTRLNAEQRSLAPVLYKILSDVKERLLASEPLEETIRNATRKIEDHPDIALEYLEVVDSNELTLVKDLSEHEEISICIAAYFGDIRLIDNLFLISR
ncbi:MAG: pantoate--beta-alanine ligase [Cyclobacteriaceae bacterium]